MAAVSAIGLAAGLAQTVFSALQTQELRDLCAMFHCQSELQKLENTMSTVKALFRDVDDQGRKLISNTSRDWIEKLKDAVYDVDDLLDEFHTIAQLRKHTRHEARFLKKVGNFFSCNNKHLFSIKVSREIKILREKLDEITTDHKNYGFNPVVFTDVVTKPVSVREVTSSVISELEIIGREIIVGNLLPDGPHSDQKVSFVSIVGVGGLGKTTLAQLVFNDERVIETFSKRIWVCVSDEESDKEFSPIKILSKILKKEVFDLEDARQKVQKLLESQRYLLVLDDVWNESHEKWRDLKPFLVFGVPGSKVIVTSRSKKVATSIGDDYVMHVLEGLSEENSWSLFELIAFGKQREDHQDDPDLVNIGKEIVKKCSSVPLSIRVTASLLRGQSKIAWERFRSNDLADMTDEDGQNSIMRTLMISYYHLTLELKSCFSFCSLFPKDHIIRKELLINMWSAHDYLVAPNKGKESPEEVGEAYLTILFNRCFFQDIKLDRHGDVYSFKMHDLMHDLAVKVAGNESLIITPTTKKQLEEKTRHLSREKGSLNLCTSDKLRSYVWLGDDYFSHRYHEDSNEVFPIVSNCKRLRILSLPKFGIACTLPNKVEKLLHLRYLDLSKNRLKMLPKSITKLHNLQILILRGCRELKELPKAMCKLVNLRTLDISGCEKLKKLSDDFSKLVNLCTLDASGCSNLKELPEGMNKLVKLRTLDIRDCHNLTYMPRGMDNLTNLQRLSLFTVEEVGVKQIEGISNLLDLQALHRSLKGNICIGLPNFYSQNMPRATNRGFILKNARLESLTIEWGSSVDNENEFGRRQVHETLIEDLCPNEDIGGIIIKGYKGMKMPCWAASLMEYSDMNGVKHVASLSRFGCLKRLVLSNLPNAEYIMEIKNDGAWESSCTLFFPVLEELVLEKMPKLKGWWRGLRWREMEGVAGGGCLVDDNGLEHALPLPCFPQLRILDIYDCKSMTYFPPCPHVKEMDLYRVNDALTFCMKESASSSSNVSTSSSCLEKLKTDNARDMNRVLLNEFAEGGVIHVELNGDSEVKSMGTLREGFERVGFRLKKLKIENCKELDMEEEEEEGMPWKYLQSLSSLRLSWLPKMVKLPKGLCHLTSLQLLCISYCDELEMEEKEEEGMPWKYLQSLSSLTLWNLEKMVKLPKGLCHLTSLQSLCISYCDELEMEEEEEEGMPWKYLQSLSSLTLQGLEKMVKLPKGLYHLTSLQSLNVENCHNMEEVGECIGSLTSLQSLELKKCEKLKGLPECIGSLTSLQTLRLWDCHKLKGLPESIRFLTSLQCLDITTLWIHTDNDEFREKCRQPDGEYWPRISHIPDRTIGTTIV